MALRRKWPECRLGASGGHFDINHDDGEHFALEQVTFVHKNYIQWLDYGKKSSCWNRLTNNDDFLEDLRLANALPENERVLKTIDPPVLGKPLIEGGDRSKEQYGMYIRKEREPGGTLETAV